ncbi:DNA topoisomerase 1 [Serratia fonticola]|uniref:DNA topoisomerase 1 n=1 Tax=Serratia fonticola TaxID=47917 RepID=A0A4U9UB17_SERFO|nr:DNA topoisomerase 1 [Serratia fonticola]
MPALRKGDEDRTLPFVEVGSELDLQKLIPSQHFTKPPARYSEASLVKELEKTRNWPSIYLRLDHLDHSGSWLCAGREPPVLRGKNG